VNRGFVLFSVIVISAVLAGIALTTAIQYQKAYLRAALDWERIRTMNAAYSALERGRIVLEQDRNETDGPQDAWFQPISAQIDTIRVTLSTTDEQGKIAVNQLIYPSGEVNHRQMEIFSEWAGMSDAAQTDFLGNLTKWRTKYKTLLASAGLLKEMAMMRGDPEAGLTVFGNGRINVNTAPEEVLKALLQNSGRDAVKDAIRIRKSEPYANAFDFKKSLDLTDEAFQRIFPLICFNSSFFRLQARAAGAEIAATAEIVAQRSSGSTRILQRREWWQ
jgi:general secretion pathway protein K